MYGGLIVQGADGTGGRTAVAGTPIVVATTRKKGCRTRLDALLYTPGANSHTLTIMRPIGRTTLAADVAAGANPFTLAADPGATGNLFAVGDYVAIVRPDGIIHVTTVATWTVGTLSGTLTGGVPTGGLANGAEVFNYGVPTDTDPISGGAHPTYPLATGAQRTVNNLTGNGVYGTARGGEPLLLYVNNVTAAGTLDVANWLFTYEPAPSQSFMGDGNGGGEEYPDIIDGKRRAA